MIKKSYTQLLWVAASLLVGADTIQAAQSISYTYNGQSQKETKDGPRTDVVAQ
ncbi:MAG: hypothetical protein KUG81_04460 [Gammaproteobacteria bacterium]|nr:hypothetical protein [Gammaproteobacteria bacterium]